MKVGGTGMRKKRNRNEQGIALIMAIFALMLLAAIGLAMMYSSNTETKINANFRDKQVAVYAAQSGTLEARNRIHPVTGDITVPSGTPSTTAQNVIYIINPSAGETVAPWDPDNQYFDTELCHEQILGLTGTEGVPCSGSSAVPGGNNWYTVYDDSSSSYTGGFKLANPLSYKWTRISLKTNNNTPVAANGASTTATQVCWNGSAQILLPTGVGANCRPSGSVIAINIQNQGSGYSSAPTLTIGAPSTGGTQATAVPIMTTTGTGAVASINLTNAGSGYTSAPTVTLTGAGTGAAAVATIYPNGGPVTNVSLGSAGTGCYQTPPLVSFVGGGGSGATATVSLNTTADCVYTWSAGGSCKAKAGDNGQAVASTGGGGSGFAGTLDFKKGQGNYQNFVVTNPGTGYTGNPTAITGISGCTFGSPVFTFGKRIASISLTTGGAGYTSAPAVSIVKQAADPGTAATATATIGAADANAGKIQSVTVTASGSGYAVAPTVSFSGGGGGSGATATATVGTTGKITGVTITNGGSGYLTNPPVTVSGGGGANAQLKAAISGGGISYTQVFLITSMAETASGSRAITQMEAAPNLASFNLPGALTLTGDVPTFEAPNSNNFFIHGNDANSCGETAITAKPAISVYNDDAVSLIGGGLPRPDHYTGTGTIPNVVNSSASAGDAMSTPEGIESLANAIAAMTGTNTYGANPSSFDLGSADNPQFSVVNGDLSLTGSTTGYGVLVIRNGNLTLGGDFSWNGVIFVIGNATIEANGGGHGQINGSMFISKTKDGTGGLLTTLGNADLDWAGGGGNGIQYDHCYVENYLSQVPFVPISTTPLRILSTRTVTY